MGRRASSPIEPRGVLMKPKRCEPGTRLTSLMLEHRRHVTRYFMVGIANAIVDFASFALLVYSFKWNVVLANTTSYSLALVQSFLLNKYWTFADRRSLDRPLRQAALFVGLNLVGLAFSNLALHLLVPPIPALVAKPITMVLVFIWNYTTNRRFVYASRL